MPDAVAGEHRRGLAWQRSRSFYMLLCAFDQLLDEIALTHPTISFDELTDGAWMADIARIFSGTQDLQEVGDAEGAHKVQRKRLLAQYRKLHRFLGDRADDVQLSQGIWHDASGAFVVGGTGHIL
ncbi:MAG: hypothetical protein ACLQUY_10780 [Ktedonobacterales bacterium]